MKTGGQIQLEIEKALLDYINKYGDVPNRLLIGVIDLRTYSAYIHELLFITLGDIKKYRGAEVIECINLEAPIFTN